MKLLLASLLLLLAAVVAPAAERVALVIGNDAYQHARPLKAAVNDATAVAGTLQRLGFDTIVASNAGLEQMIEAMDKLKTQAADAQAVLVYYAGHGIESQGANYLIPVDAKLEKEVQLQTQAVNLNGVLDKLTALNVPARMVILDCCRDNPLEGRAWLATRSAGGGGLGELPVQTLPAATLVVYAASPGKPALDRVSETDTHSPFTQALLDTLPEPGVHSFEVFGRVEETVLTRTEGRQSPRVFYNGSTLPFRNFTFAGQPATAATVPAMTVIQIPAADQPPPLPARGFFDLNELFTGTRYELFNSYTRSQILKRVQEKLKSDGYYKGAADGIPGPGTHTAIVARQQALSLPLTGKLGNEELESHGIISLKEMIPPKSAAKPASPVRQPNDAAKNLEAQKRVLQQFQRRLSTTQQRVEL